MVRSDAGKLFVLYAVFKPKTNGELSVAKSNVFLMDKGEYRAAVQRNGHYLGFDLFESVDDFEFGCLRHFLKDATILGLQNRAVKVVAEKAPKRLVAEMDRQIDNGTFDDWVRSAY